MIYNFSNDYSEGAHARILDALVATNSEQSAPYGTDSFCETARSRIGKQLNRPESAVHFVVGGTQANALLISAALRPHQGVVSADSGHINIHESGAIEAYGHKVLTIPSADGKVRASQVEALFRAHFSDATAEHMVQPGMLYLSNPTELGTIYTKSELTALWRVCHAHHARLYIDGARLGCALTAPGNDVTLADLATLSDAFTIGGTKMGALFGEAIVINDPALNTDFRYLIKQHGAMLAKGRLLGLQFATLFDSDALYFSLARHANAMAERLRAGLAARNVPFLVDTPTNQLFPILPQQALQAVAEQFGYSFWQQVGESRDAVRFCTSWATPEAQVDALLCCIDAALRS